MFEIVFRIDMSGMGIVDSFNGFILMLIDAAFVAVSMFCEAMLTGV